MKDILFEKHYEIIVKHNDDAPYPAAVACANTTKEMMKGFGQFLAKNTIDSVYRKVGFIWIDSDGTELTTEELLEKYLEILNQK